MEYLSSIAGFLGTIGADAADALLIIVIGVILTVFLTITKSLKREIERTEERCKEQGALLSNHIRDMGAGINARVSSIEKRNQKSTDDLWVKYHEVNGKYNRLDALGYATAKVIEAKTGVALVNDSADGSGDYTLRR